MDVIIYHNPACETSRNTLALIRNAGVEPHVVEYLRSPPTREMLRQLVTRAELTIRDILRRGAACDPPAEAGAADHHSLEGLWSRNMAASHAGELAGGIEARNDAALGTEDAAGQVRLNSAHRFPGDGKQLRRIEWRLCKRLQAAKAASRQRVEGSVILKLPVPCAERGQSFLDRDADFLEELSRIIRRPDMGRIFKVTKRCLVGRFRSHRNIVIVDDDVMNRVGVEDRPGR